MKKLIPMIGVAAFALGAFAKTPGLLVAEEPMSFEAGETGVTEVPGLFNFTSPVTLDEVDYNLWFSSSAVSDGTAKVKAYEGSVGYTYPTEGEAVRNPALAGAGSSSYLAVETAKNSPLYRTLNGNNGELAAVALTTNVYVDTLVQFTGFEEPQSITAGKIAVWMSAIEAEGTPGTPAEGVEGEEGYVPAVPPSADYVQGETNLYVSCGAINGEGEANATNIKIVKDGLEVGKWYRLTVKAVDGIFLDAGIITEGLEQRLGFVVYIDGQAVGYARTTAEKNSVIDEAVAEYLTTDAKALWNAGLLFPALEAGVSLAAVGFEGTGSVDDLVIDDVGPEFAWAIPEPPASDVTFTVPAIANATVVAKVDGVALVPNADGSYTVPAGTLVTIEVTPNEGYKVNHNTMNVTPTEGEELDVSEFQVTEKGFILLIADGEELSDYTNIVDAVTAATEGATILVTQDFALDAATAITEKNLTLDLGGKTLTMGDQNLDVSATTLVITNGTITSAEGVLTLKDSSVVTLAADATIAPSQTYKFEVDDATLNVYGTIENLGASEAAAATIHANMDGGIINVYEGAYIHSAHNDAFRLNAEEGCVTVNVYGGTIEANGGYPTFYIYKTNNESVVNVYGGTLIGADQGIFQVKDTKATVTPLTDACTAKFNKVEAGTWAGCVAIADICAEGYGPVKDEEDGYYTIQEKAAPTTYAITIAEGIENGTVAASAETAEAGETITLTVNPNAGYQIASVTTNSVAIEAVEGAYSFVMPAEAVEVAATFELIPPTTYAITIAKGIENGAVTADKAAAAAGETVTLTVTPVTDYVIDTVTTNGAALAAVEGVYSFVMPAQAVEVAATFKAAEAPLDWDHPKQAEGTAGDMFGLTGDIAAANGQELAAWAKGNGGVDFSAASSIKVDAFLLNCANTDDAITAAKAAFKFTAIEPGKVPTVSGDYNGTLTIKGSTDLETWHTATAADNFFKAELSL